MTHLNISQKWRENAERHLKSAKILMESNDVNDIVAFHCQQAIEKTFKGFLVAKRGMVVEGHSLLKLYREAKSDFLSMTELAKECAFVNQYYIETRYPSDDPLEVTQEDAADCIRIAQTIMDEIIRELGSK